jgi:hypothetical protein
MASVDGPPREVVQLASSRSGHAGEEVLPVEVRVVVRPQLRGLDLSPLQ